MSAVVDTAGAAPAADMADLYADARQLVAGEGDAGLPLAPGAPGPQEPPPATNAEVIAGLLSFARDSFCAITGYQSPKVHLADPEVSKLASLWGAVCDKRKINLAKLQGEHWDLIAAAGATVPIALALRAGMSAEMAERIKASQPETGKAGDQVAEPLPVVEVAPPVPGQAATWDGDLTGGAS